MKSNDALFWKGKKNFVRICTCQWWNNTISWW